MAILIALGSNMGQRPRNLETALNHIRKRVGATLKSSKIYETEPWGDTQQPLYLNQIVEVQTSLSPQRLIAELLDIEQVMGRVRNTEQQWAARVIDLDLLFYDDEVIDTPQLQVPHPRLHQRNFILLPLMEMDYDELIHPVLNQSISDLYCESSDEQEVYLYEG